MSHLRLGPQTPGRFRLCLCDPTSGRRAGLLGEERPRGGAGRRQPECRSRISARLPSAPQGSCEGAQGGAADGLSPDSQMTVKRLLFLGLLQSEVTPRT